MTLSNFKCDLVPVKVHSETGCALHILLKSQVSATGIHICCRLLALDLSVSALIQSTTIGKLCATIAMDAPTVVKTPEVVDQPPLFLKTLLCQNMNSLIPFIESFPVLNNFFNRSSLNFLLIHDIGRHLGS